MGAERGRHLLIGLSAALATRDHRAIRAALERAREPARPQAVEEVLLQSHLFLGFPDALNALTLWREVSGRPPPSSAPENRALWQERGETVCAQVYRENYTKLRANMAALNPEVDRWMVETGYGQVIGRPGLDLVTRELCIAALLAVWNAPRQLHSHLRGALNCGASVAEVGAAVEIACRFLSANRADQVRKLWEEVRRRKWQVGNEQHARDRSAAAGELGRDSRTF